MYYEKGEHLLPFSFGGIMTIGDITMPNVFRLFDRFNHIQRYALDMALSINNYIGTPSYRVLLEISPSETITCDRNLIVDVVNINGEAKLSVYVYVFKQIFLIYNDNPKYIVSKELTEKFKKFDFVQEQFDKFSVMREPSSLKEEMTQSS